jgi:hypothetical protein
MKNHTHKFVLLSTLMAALLASASTTKAEVLVSNNFNAPGTPSDFYWNAGSFTNASFNQAWNSSTTGQQFFTTSFASTSLGVGDVLKTTFLYNPNVTNISSVRVGLFSGTAATSNGWDQWSASAFSSGWVGYTGTLAVLSGNSAASLKTNTTGHSFFDATNGITSVAEFFGTGVLRAGSLTLERNIDSIVVTLSEGANFGSLAPVVSFTDNSSAITNFNILSFYMQSSGNADMRYDTVQVEFEAVPEPNTYALLLLGGVLAFLMARRIRSRSRASNG